MTLRRRWFIARERFHDWMWDGGPGYGWTPRRLARRLPLYFSDPYWISPKKIARMDFGPSVEVNPSGPTLCMVETRPGLTLSTASVSTMKIYGNQIGEQP